MQPNGSRSRSMALGRSVDQAWMQKQLKAENISKKRADSQLSTAPRHEGGLHVSLKKQERNGSILQLADV